MHSLQTQAVTPEYVVVELKECERCPALFTRAADEPSPYCPRCREKMVLRAKRAEERWRGDAPKRGQAYLAELDRRMEENSRRPVAPVRQAQPTRYQQANASRDASGEACRRKDGLTGLQASDVVRRMCAAGRKVHKYHCSPGCGKYHVAGAI
jgi:hypothetical protein